MINYSILNPSTGSAITVVTVFGTDANQIIAKLVPANTAILNPVENKNYLISISIDGEPLDEALVCFRDSKYFLYLHASQAILSKLVHFLIAEGAYEACNSDDSSQLRALRLARSRFACHLFAATNINQLKYVVENAIVSCDKKRLELLYQHSYYAVLAQQTHAVFLTGPTNAGKSTLFNILVDKQLALVSNVCYTTRDALSASVILNGIEIELYDTPGSGDFDNAMQDLQSYNHFETLLSEADVIVNFYPLDKALPIDFNPNDEVLNFYSKLDLANNDVLQMLPDDAIKFSSVTGDGLEQIKKSLLHRLYPYSLPKIGDTVCFSKKQYEIVKKLCKILEKDKINEAMELYKNNEKVFR